MPSSITREDFRTRGRNLGTVREFPEAATQTFVTNDFVWVINGQVALPVTAGNTVALAAAYNTTTGTAGFVLALEPATGTTNNKVSCLVMSEEFEWLGIIVNGTAQRDSINIDIGASLGFMTLRYIAANSPAGITTTFWGADQGTLSGIVKPVEFDPAETVGTSGNYHKCWMKLTDPARFGSGTVS